MRQATIMVTALTLGLSLESASICPTAVAATFGATTRAGFTRSYTQQPLTQAPDADLHEVYAQGQSHRGQGKDFTREKEGFSESQLCGPYFKASALPHFHDYYSRNDYSNLPPGLRKHLAKSGHLPPGLEKKYAETGQLPPGLQNRFECGQTMPPDYSSYLYPVPYVAYERFAPLPPDSQLYLFGRDLILLNEHTRAIIDILRDVY